MIGACTAYDLRITRDTNIANIGKTPSNIPEMLASLWVDYTIPTSPSRGLGAAAGVRYVGNSFANAENTFKVPEIDVGDLNVHYDTGAWRAAVNITNFTDEKHVASCVPTSSCHDAERRRITGSLAHRARRGGNASAP